MDPLSITASIVGIVGFSLQSIDYISNYCSEYRDRVENLDAIERRISFLKGLLESLQSNLSSGPPATSPSQSTELTRAVLEAHGAINNLKTKLDKAIAKTNSQNKLSRTVSRLTFPLKKETFDKLIKHTDVAQQNLLLAIQILQLEEAQVLRETTHLINKTAHSIQKDVSALADEAVRRWLNAPDSQNDCEIALRKRLKGSGEWFIKSTAFMDWIANAASFFWLHGFAGCGKSVLSATIVDHVQNLVCAQRSPARICASAFFFFSFRETSKQNAEGCLRSLAVQLASQLPELDADLRALKETSATVPDLRKVLRQNISRAQSVYIVVDALDESPIATERGEVLDLIEEIRNWSEPSLHLLVTSRDESDIRISLHLENEEMLQMRNESIATDIENYIEDRLRNDRHLAKFRSHHDLIANSLKTRAAGV